MRSYKKNKVTRIVAAVIAIFLVIGMLASLVLSALM